MNRTPRRRNLTPADTRTDAGGARSPARAARRPAVRLLAAATATAATLALVPTAASAGGGGGVAGPCGTITSISASPVTMSASAGTYGSTTLAVRGEVANCSIYLQQYWIDVDEPATTNPACRASFSLFNALILSSGSRQGFSTSTSITPAGSTSAAGCAGVHTLRAVLRSRINGAVLSTVTTAYTVTVK